MYAVLLVLCVGILFAGVNCGSETTEIGWVNGAAGETISDIVWFDDTNNINQTWNEKNITTGLKTEQKEVTKITGYAECVSNGTAAKRIFTVYEGNPIPVNGGSVSEGSATYYTIDKTE